MSADGCGWSGDRESGCVLQLQMANFGHHAFLSLQEDIVMSVMARRDAFELVPSDGGKSLRYQLPAMALPGLTLVVSHWRL